MLTKNLSYYEYCFINLSINRQKNIVSPHKPLLLLSIIDLVESGIINSPIMELSNALVEAFKRNAKIYVSEIEHFKPNIGMPFLYMRSEPFWQLVTKVDGVTPVANTISSLRKHYAHARIDDELYQLLLSQMARDSLRRLLITTYFVT